jgi:hypothetical protein
MADDSDWTKEKLFQHAGEIGAQKARQEAADANITRIADEMNRGFSDINHSIAGIREAAHADSTRESAHIRAEIKRIDEALANQKRDAANEALKHKQDIINSLTESNRQNATARDQAQRTTRIIVAIVVLLGVGAQTLIENVPTLVHALGF